MFKIYAFFLTLFVSSVALAQDTVPEQAPEIINVLVSSFKDGQWHIFASAVIMACVWLITKAPGLSGLIKGKAKVWVAAVVGILSAVAVTAFTTDGDWFAAIANGFAVGLSATGLFELIRRKVSNEAIDADNDGVLDPK